MTDWQTIAAIVLIFVAFVLARVDAFTRGYCKAMDDAIKMIDEECEKVIKEREDEQRDSTQD